MVMGYLKISKDVMINEAAYATIVYYAVTEIEEVTLHNEKKKELTERQLKQTVKLDKNEYGIVVNIYVEVCYGNNLEEVCKKIQENVVDILEQSVGYKPACVNVIVTKVLVCD